MFSGENDYRLSGGLGRALEKRPAGGAVLRPPAMTQGLYVTICRGSV